MGFCRRAFCVPYGGRGPPGYFFIEQDMNRHRINCVFRPDPNRDSGNIRTLNLVLLEHSFWLYPNINSGAFEQGFWSIRTPA